MKRIIVSGTSKTNSFKTLFTTSECEGVLEENEFDTITQCMRTRGSEEPQTLIFDIGHLDRDILG